MSGRQRRGRDADAFRDLRDRSPRERIPVLRQLAEP